MFVSYRTPVTFLFMMFSFRIYEFSVIIFNLRQVMCLFS